MARGIVELNALVLAGSMAVAGCGGGGWEVWDDPTTVDSANERPVDVAIASNGEIEVAYRKDWGSDCQEGCPVYDSIARWADGEWTTSNRFPSEVVQIAAEGSTFHLAGVASDGFLGYSTRPAGAEWSPPLWLDLGASDFGLAVGPDGAVAISYAAGGALAVAHLADGAVVGAPETILAPVENCSFGREPLWFDDQGHLYLLVGCRSTSSYVLASNATGEWQVEEIPHTGWSDQVGMAVGPGDTVHVVLGGEPSVTMRREGGSWTEPVRVDAETDSVALHPAVTPDGRLVVVVAREEANTIHLAMSAGGAAFESSPTWEVDSSDEIARMPLLDVNRVTGEAVVATTLYRDSTEVSRVAVGRLDLDSL